MFKKFTTVVTANRGPVVQRALIIGGTAAGAIIANGLLDRLKSDDVDKVVIEETVEEPENTDTPE